MLIGFSGAGGVGKTTTAKLVAKKLGIPFLPSTSRGVFERHGITEDDQNRMQPAEKFALQKEIFAAKEAQEVEFTEGVGDRTLIDQYAYAHFRAGGAISYADSEHLWKHMTRSLDTYYRLVIHFPFRTFSDPDKVGDGLRTNWYGDRKAYDYLLTGVLERLRYDGSLKRCILLDLNPALTDLNARVHWICGMVQSLDDRKIPLD